MQIKVGDVVFFTLDTGAHNIFISEDLTSSLGITSPADTTREAMCTNSSLKFNYILGELDPAPEVFFANYSRVRVHFPDPGIFFVQSARPLQCLFSMGFFVTVTDDFSGQFS